MTNLDEHRKYYDEYWSNRETRLNAHEVLRLSMILKAFSLIPQDSKGRSPRICDLGCGNGWLSNELTKFGSVTGVDLSPEGVAQASK